MNRCWLAVPLFVICNYCLAVESSESVSLRVFVNLYAKQESKDVMVDPRAKGMVDLQSGMTPLLITADQFYNVLITHNWSAYEADGVLFVVPLGMIRHQKIPFFDGQHRGDLVQNQVVSSIIELKNRPAKELLPTLRPLVQPWGHLAADETSNSLAVVTTVGNVERLIELVVELDKANKWKAESELPVRIITVTIDKAEHEMLFDKFREFADIHGFAIRVAVVSPSGEHFLVHMLREDFKILAVNPFDGGVFEIGFYENDVHPIPIAYLNDLLNDLRRLIGQIESAVLSEQQG